MAKWEYCVLRGVDCDNPNHTFEPYFPELTFFSTNGIEKQTKLGKRDALFRPQNWQKVSEAGYVSSVIAQLGIEGWEMVNAVSIAPSTGTSIICIYFRRQISE